MAVKTSTASGKSSATGTWSNAKKAEAGDDIIVTGGFAVEWNSAVRVRSIEVQAGSTLSGTTGLELGASSAGNNGVSENILLKFAVGATVTWKSTVNILSTFTTEAQTISTGGHAITSIKLVSTNTAKVALTEAVSASAGAGTSEVEGGTLETGSFTHTWTGFSMSAGGAVLFGTTIFKIVAGGSPSVALVNGTVTGASGLTIEVEAESGTVELNARTIGALVVKIKNVTLTPGASGCTIGNLTANNKGVTAGNGLKITKGQKVTVTGTLACNGTEAERARIESTEAGKAAKLKVVEQEVSGLALQDIAVETGVLYIVKGSNVSGNTEVGTTVKFEAKPAPASGGLGMIV